MKPTLNVYALPNLVAAEDLAGGTAVVIDVLRATTTIVYALDAGAKAVVPCVTISDALTLAKQFPPGEVLLAGERDAVAIEGFDLGNSPDEFTPERVDGKTVVFTTTNGTQAIGHARSADEVVLAAFANADAVVRHLYDRHHVHIICAGTDGKISEDDVLLAGMLVERLVRECGIVYTQNGQAITAREMWLHAFSLPQALGAEVLHPDRVADELRKSLGAKNLLSLGLDADILAASWISRFDLVPLLDRKTMQIRAAGNDEGMMKSE
jgi:2-phosphosulfolactate phosphatase